MKNVFYRRQSPMGSRVWRSPVQGFAYPRQMLFAALLTVSGISPVEAAITISKDDASPLVIQRQLMDPELLASGRLQVTLAGYDVSSLVTSDNSAFYLQLAGAIDPGTYRLTFMVINNNNKSMVAYEDTLNVVAITRTASFEARNNTSYRLDEKEKADFTESVRLMSESALRVQASQQSNNTQLTANADIQHKTDTNTLSGEKLEIANFHLGYQQKTNLGTLGFSAGNQTVATQGLVFNGFNRRGLGAQYESTDQQLKLNTFFINTDPEISYKDNLLVAGNKEERSFGGSLDYQVFNNHPERLRIQAGIIDGQSQLQGIGITYTDDLSAEVLTYGGSSWQLALSSAWLENGLHFYAERAGSKFDLDGIDQGEDEQSDSAYHYSVSVQSRGPLANLLKPIKASFWQASYQQKEVGRQFYSLANLSLPGDLKTQQTSLQIGWPQVQFASGYYQGTTNTDKLDTLARQKTQQTYANLAYTPAVNREKPLWQTLGQPNLTLQVSETDRSQNNQDALIVGYNLDDQTREIQVGINLQRDILNLGLQHSLVDYTNNADALEDSGVLLFLPGPDTKNQFTSLIVNYRPTNQIALNPTLQWSDYQESNNGNGQSSINAGLTASFSFPEQRISVHTTLNRLDQDSEFSVGIPTQNYKSDQASLFIDWTAIKAHQSNAGLKMSLRNYWNKQQVSQAQSLSQYQIVLALELYWAQGDSQ